MLIILHLFLLALSSRFTAGYSLAERPILLLAGLEILAGLVWLVAVWPPSTWRPSGRGLWFMIAVGILLRGLMLFSTPILEDDYWRYLWDGAVTAQGHSPYAHSPQEFLMVEESTRLPPDLQSLADEDHGVLSHINHPSLRTIYPPLSQAAFALAWWISPWSLIAWRLVLLVFDAATLVLLLLLLRHLALPPLWAAIYWWCPLLILQSVNGAHMDVLALPFVLGALLLSLRKKPIWGIVLLSLAVGVKGWPLILLPFLFRPLLSSPRRFIAALALSSGILLLLAWPTVQGMMGAGSGMAAYAEQWEMNDALFMALMAGIRWILGGVGAADLAPVAARGAALLLLAGWVGWLAWPPVRSAQDLARRMLLAVAGLFLLSPTQFPWYALWMLPLLALQPRLSLMGLMVLLPLYYLRFYLDARDQVVWFDKGIVWLEYLPVWGLLLWEAIRRQPFTGPDQESGLLPLNGEEPS